MAMIIAITVTLIIIALVVIIKGIINGINKIITKYKIYEGEINDFW